MAEYGEEACCSHCSDLRDAVRELHNRATDLETALNHLSTRLDSAEAIGQRLGGGY